MKAKLNTSYVEKENFMKQLVKRNARNNVRAVTVPKKIFRLAMAGLYRVRLGVVIKKG